MRTAPCMILAVVLADPGPVEVVWEGGASDGAPLMAPWVQPARRGPSGRAARRSAGVCSPTRGPVTRGMAAAPARPASGASAVRQVSPRMGFGGRQGRLTPPTPLSHPAECEPGYFGLGCRQACTCPVGVACDPVSGECGKQCPAGFQGEDCDQGEWLAPGAPGGLCGSRLPAWLEGGLQKACMAVTIGLLRLSSGGAWP